MTAPTNKEMPHLFATFVALGLAAIILLAAQRILIHLEHATIASTAPEIFALKNQGLAFQRAAAQSRKVLPIYGSSELFHPEAAERGNIFFRTAPTGFRLSPVGGGGAKPLNMLQKVGRNRLSVARQKAGLLAFARLVLHGNPRFSGIQGEFFADGSDRDGAQRVMSFCSSSVVITSLTEGLSIGSS